MFSSIQNTSILFGAYRLLELIFHNTVRSVRSGHRDALFAIFANILQTLVMIAAFYFFIEFMGMRQLAIRGDFLLYVMSGIFVFMVNIKAMGAVAGAEGPTSAMMQHLPMNTTVAIWSAALSALYTQVIGLFVILGGYHLLWKPLVIDDPVGASLMILLAWFNGCAIGAVLLAAKPWFPRVTATVQQIYSRFNMFASGKMFVANMLPVHLAAFFAWNPLFHIIDQGRGYLFINYNPLKTSLTYPIVVSVVLLVIGLIAESQTRRHASLSWTAGR
ncbi:ABC transporter permease [Rhodobacteraceae bacterium]|nr:ABC transporter permease [Paracoccaceae bacterium]